MNLKIEAKEREIAKKSVRKKMRKEGFIPAVVYGKDFENKLVFLETNVFKRQFRKSLGGLAFWDIKLGDDEFTTILKDKQVHPVSRDIVHLDFQVLNEGEEMTLNIPMRYVGSAIGVKNGGVLEIHTRSIEVQCLPKDIVEDFKIDISDLDIGDSIHVRDIEADKMTIKDSPEQALVLVQPPEELEEETEEEELELAEGEEAEGEEETEEEEE